MVLFLALAAITSANVAYDRYGNASELTVVSDGRRYAAKPDYGQLGPNLPLSKLLFGSTEIHADGTKLVQADGKLIVDAMSCSRELFPKVPEQYDNPLALRSKGGLLIGDRALWIFSWDAFETMSEPSGETFAIELWKDGSTIHAGRIAPLKGLGAHIYFRGVVRFGDTLAMVADGISFFNDLYWEETKAMTGGEACVSGGDRIYWDAGNLYRYDPDTGKFQLKAHPELGYLAKSYSFGKQDVLVFQHGLLNPESRAVYTFPGGGNAPNGFYQVGNLALGFLSSAFPPPEPGILLSPGLEPIGMISARR